VASARVQRGRQSEEIVAERLRQSGLLYAERRPASLPGSDITGIPGVDIEVKATKDWSPTTWLAQQRKRASSDVLRVVVYRPQGYGADKVDLWPAVMSLGDWLKTYGEVLLT
jgi:hypothetical protein